MSTPWRERYNLMSPSLFLEDNVRHSTMYSPRVCLLYDLSAERDATQPSYFSLSSHTYVCRYIYAHVTTRSWIYPRKFFISSCIILSSYNKHNMNYIISYITHNFVIWNHRHFIPITLQLYNFGIWLWMCFRIGLKGVLWT